jgi:hypothetical protein
LRRRLNVQELRLSGHFAVLLVGEPKANNILAVGSSFRSREKQHPVSEHSICPREVPTRHLVQQFRRDAEPRDLKGYGVLAPDGCVSAGAKYALLSN